MVEDALAEVEMEHPPEPEKIADDERLVEPVLGLHRLERLGRELGVHLEGSEKVARREIHNNERDERDPDDERDRVDQAP